MTARPRGRLGGAAPGPSAARANGPAAPARRDDGPVPGERREVAGLRGPKVMSVVVLVFTGACLLSVHLMYLPPTPDTPRPGTRAQPVRAGTAIAERRREATPGALAVTPAALPPAGPAAGIASPEDLAPETAAAGEGDLRFLAPEPLVVHAPLPPPPNDRERALSDCVARKTRGARLDDPKPTAPGRWPALKRAREQRRLQLAAVRVECQREMGL